MKNWCCGRNCSVDIGGRPVLKLSDDDTGEGEAEREMSIGKRKDGCTAHRKSHYMPMQ